MRALRFWSAVAVLAASATLLADDRTVLFDKSVDFTAFHTFTIGARTISSERPELKFPALAEMVSKTLFDSLVARGLTAAASGELAASFRISSDDYGVGPFGRPGIIRPTPRGSSGDGNTLKVAYTEATLVVDLVRVSDGLLVWRGVYRDTEAAAAKFGETLPKYAASLLTEFPPKKAK